MKNRLIIFFAVTLLQVLILTHLTFAQYNIPGKMKWWYEDRFGMFIHFGSYSYLGHGEWAFSTENWTKADYQTQVSANFNPDKFDAGIIARLAKEAGMKYLVITAKHHEGFSIWKTEVQSFKDVTGNKMYSLPDFTKFGDRDILKELKDSCEANGIKFCLYYSILDWSHSSQTIFHGDNWYTFSTIASDSAKASYIKDMKLQLTELITKYHPAVLWFDGDWTYNSGSPTATKWWTKADGNDLYNFLINIDSSLIINERVARSFGLGDFECPEQEIPSSPRSRQWETCQTMNGSWGYASWDNNYKSAAALIQELAIVVSRDGNYLLNIGPKGDGTVPPQSITLLTSIGEWMDTYSESIYGTTRSPFKTEPAWGVYTKKEGKLFAHIFEWPANNILVPSLTSTVNKVYLLNDPATELTYTDTSGVINISLPAKAPNINNSVMVLEVSGEPAVSTVCKKVTRIVVKSLRGITTISVGDTLKMAAVITPVDATIQAVTWSVSDTARASISADGLLIAKKNGSIDVSATANDGTYIKGQLKITFTAATGIDEESELIPKTPVLEQNYPNPFNPATTINFTLPVKSFVTMKLYNILGSEITTLISEELHAGQYSKQWDASGSPSGIYYCWFKSNSYSDTKKLVFIK